MIIDKTSNGVKRNYKILYFTIFSENNNHFLACYSHACMHIRYIFIYEKNSKIFPNVVI